MKRLWAAAVLFAVVVGVCVWERCYLNVFSNEIYSKLESVNAQYSAENYAEAQKTAKELECRWVGGEKVLCHFVSNSALNDIGTAVSKLPSLVESENDDFYTEYRELQVLLRHMLNGEKVTVY